MNVLTRSAHRALRSLGLHVYRDPKAKARYSSLEEGPIIDRYVRDLGITERTVVDIGAADGVHGSNTYALFRAGWTGLAIEYDGPTFGILAHHYRGFPGASLVRARVTPENVLDILAAAEVPQKPGVLSLDIDGYDHFVLEAVLERHRPQLMCVEINEKIPPPIKFTVRYHPDYAWGVDHFFGQSLAKLDELTRAKGYEILEVHYNNAFLAPREIAAGRGITPEDAYARGYRDQPDRTTRFAYNADVDALLTMSPEEGVRFLRERFARYDGQFDCYV